METKNIRKYLMLGIIGAAVTVAGELLQGAVVAPEMANEMVRIFSTIGVLPVWRIGLGSTLGGLGILMQWFGFHGICLSFDNKNTRMASAYRAGNLGFAILGSLVHILMSVYMFVYKLTSPMGMGHTYRMEFMNWFVMPITVIFFAAYGLFSVTMFIQFFKKHTVFQKWSWVLNPVIGKIVINMLTAVLPNTALVNGIGFADMGLTSLITFVVLYCLCK